MTANITIQATLNNSANFFVISWELASGGGIISSVSPPKPYGNPFNINVPGLTPNLTYIIKLWESMNTSPGGTLRNATNVIATSMTTSIRADDYLTTDITAGLVSGTTAYVNATYVGWTYDVERVGQGTMYPQGAPDVFDPDYAQDSGGGFHLLRTSDVFGVNEKFAVRFQPQVAPVESSGQGIVTTGEIIITGETFTAADLNKAIFLQGSSSSMISILPPLSSVSDYQWLYFFSAGGSHISAVLNCASTDKIQRNTLVGQIILGQNEQLKLFKANGVWNIDYISPSVDLVGELVYRYNLTPATGYGFNTVPLDGSLLSRTTYARLFAYLQNSGITPVSETTWNAITTLDTYNFALNCGNWTLGTDGTNFRVPDLRTQFLRGGGTSLIAAGVGSADTAIKHKHATGAGSLPGNPNGKAPNAGPGLMGLYQNPGNLPVDLTTLLYNDPGPGGTGTFIQRVGNETAPKHIYVPIHVRI